ncbi:MAG: murein biosynthesis integral membrane protein MurJ [Anaerolineae bacterium]
MSTETCVVDTTPSAPPAGQGIAQAAGVIALGNVTSRLLGLVRETVIAHLFGATGLVSTFRLASRVPTMIFDLLIGGMISSALIPVFSDYAASERREELWRIASVMFSLTLVLFSALVLLLEFLAPQIAWLLGTGYGPRLQAITTTLIRIILPSVAFFGLSAVLAGLLYSQQRFVYPAFGAAIFNAGIIVGALVLAPYLDIASLSLGVLLGAILQTAIQLPGLRGMRLTFSLDLSHPGLRRVAELYTPVMLGLVISQAAVALDTNLASRAGEQALAWMQNATTLIQFPLGLVVTAISLAVLPSLARLNVQADLEGFRRTLALGLRLVLVLIVPATVGLFVLGRPIVALLFEHGAFTPHDTIWTTWALDYYLLGLPFAAIDQPLVYAFYARQDTRTPVLVGVMAIGVYLIVALSLIRPLGMVGLVLANSAQWFSHALVMLTLLHRRLGALRGQRLGVTALKALLASAAMGGAIQLALAWMEGTVDVSAPAGEAILVGGAGLIGLAVYGALIWLLQVEEVRLIREVVWRRVRR